jgi:hypothetical protein
MDKQNFAKVAAKNGYEAWIRLDIDSGMWEVFTDRSAEGYVGCADTYKDAVMIGKDWVTVISAA